MREKNCQSIRSSKWDNQEAKFTNQLSNEYSLLLHSGFFPPCPSAPKISPQKKRDLKFTELFFVKKKKKVYRSHCLLHYSVSPLEDSYMKFLETSRKAVSYIYSKSCFLHIQQYFLHSDNGTYLTNFIYPQISHTIRIVILYFPLPWFFFTHKYLLYIA